MRLGKAGCELEVSSPNWWFAVSGLAKEGAGSEKEVLAAQKADKSLEKDAASVSGLVLDLGAKVLPRFQQCDQISLATDPGVDHRQVRACCH